MFYLICKIPEKNWLHLLTLIQLPYGTKKETKIRLASLPFHKFKCGEKGLRQNGEIIIAYCFNHISSTNIKIKRGC
ncbi:unnamed protein product [Lactuca virosa]|uniref:Uncharacterized protein n=1 Tax=Lactuca virosa TaxID=75947 RepID=A0AAU9N599_9ASTR|nr:unnamed protein product [Lactuca virosa]